MQQLFERGPATPEDLRRRQPATTARGEAVLPQQESWVERRRSAREAQGEALGSPERLNHLLSPDSPMDRLPWGISESPDFRSPRDCPGASCDHSSVAPAGPPVSVAQAGPPAAVSTANAGAWSISCERGGVVPELLCIEKRVLAAKDARITALEASLAARDARVAALEARLQRALEGEVAAPQPFVSWAEPETPAACEPLFVSWAQPSWADRRIEEVAASTHSEPGVRERRAREDETIDTAAMWEEAFAEAAALEPTHAVRVQAAVIVAEAAARDSAGVMSADEVLQAEFDFRSLAAQRKREANASLRLCMHVKRWARRAEQRRAAVTRALWDEAFAEAAASEPTGSVKRQAAAVVAAREAVDANELLRAEAEYAAFVAHRRCEANASLRVCLGVKRWVRRKGRGRTGAQGLVAEVAGINSKWSRLTEGLVLLEDEGRAGHLTLAPAIDDGAPRRALQAVGKPTGATALASGGDAAVGLLRDVRSLTCSSLGWGCIHCTLLTDVLSQCRELRILRLSSNEIGDAGAGALADALTGGALGSLWELNLYYNRVGDGGARALAGAASRGALSSLRELYLCRNRIGDAGMQAIADAITGGLLTSCTYIDLDNNSLATEAGKRAVRDAAKTRESLTVDVVSYGLS